MTQEGFIEYKRREFCKDIQCPVQINLDKLTDASPAYEQTRKKCSSNCLYTTWQFHHWLIEKGYIIIASSQLKNTERTVLANIDKGLADWIDALVQNGKYCDRSHLIECALHQYKKAMSKNKGPSS